MFVYITAERLITIDRYSDYVPVISTVTNLVDLCCKSFFLPNLTAEQISNNPYYTHLKNKSVVRSAALLVPIAGNLAVHFCTPEPVQEPVEIEEEPDDDYSVLGKIKSAQLTKLRWLDLHMIRLTSLPTEIGMLTHLVELNLYINDLASLPTEIGLLRDLLRLDLSSNQLTTLPTEIGQLTRLSELKLELNYGENKLSFLPTEIGLLTSLTQLSLWMNQLTSLPTEIGLLTSLTHLNLTNNQLTSLPIEIGSLINLEQLRVNDNRTLAELPMTLGQIPGLTVIDITNTEIAPSICASILNQCRMMRDAEAAKVLPLRLSKWQSIAKSQELEFDLMDDQKKTLNEWLLRLEKTKDFARAQAPLARIVCNILADLFKNKEFQELFFSHAEANNACCEDRAAMSLNEIYTSWNILCQSARLPTAEKLKMMTGVAKTLCLRKALQKLIEKQERESVEIFLFYESMLKEKLQLVTAIREMTYSQIGKREWINKDALIRHVEAHFFDELFELPLFERMVMEERRSEWRAIDFEFSGELEKLGDCPKGGPNDRVVLDHQHRQGEMMSERKRKKFLLAQEWYHSLV